jgi:pimeloyl-ACP methyl ester carboxylesterase
MTYSEQANPTIVLVHAAWVDGSSWSRVIPRLRAKGLSVIAPQLPLTSLEADTLALKKVLSRVSRPVVLAAHSYGGAVITSAASGEDGVKALVYIAAMAPDEGETVAALLHRAPAHPLAPALAPDADGLLWMTREGFADAVAPGSSADELDIMTAVQIPTAVQCITQPMRTPAWQQIPSWYLLAEQDRIIAAETQRFMAERANATIISKPLDHTPLTSASQDVVDIIIEAAASPRALGGPFDGVLSHQAS